MVKLKRGTFQHVESELFAYHDTKREILKIKNELLYGTSNPDENVGGGRSSTPSDPTGSTATLLASHVTIEQMERIVNAIDQVYSLVDKDKQKLMQLRYWTKPQTLTWDGIALELNVSRITAMRWRDRIVREVARRIGWR